MSPMYRQPPEEAETENANCRMSTALNCKPAGVAYTLVNNGMSVVWIDINGVRTQVTSFPGINQVVVANFPNVGCGSSSQVGTFWTLGVGGHQLGTLLAVCSACP